MMICAVIKGPSYEEAFKQINEAEADLVELRLDCFTQLDLQELKKLRSKFSIPMIFTLRAIKQGGNYSKSEENRLIDIEKLLSLQPEYIDLESDLAPEFIQRMISLHNRVKVILSYHNFIETPEDLEGLYQEMKKNPAHFYKMAMMAQSAIDTMRLLCWQKNMKENLIAISMGAVGQISRIVGRSPLTYAALDKSQQTAPGQISIKTLRSLQSFRKKPLYGLIGDPVEQSISDQTHNHCNLDALYVKVPVKTLELPHFLHYAKLLPFHGLSVTMPLKEAILPFLDTIDPEAKKIGAVNTLLIEQGKIHGYNTDGIGALNAIEKKCSVKDKKIVLMGSGGASKAIAFEASKRGAVVSIFSRNQLECIGDESYDILINCTPIEMPLSCEAIIPGIIVMDIKTKPKETLLLQEAKKRGCTLIYGYEMFVEQALGQFALWFPQIDIATSRELLIQEALRALCKKESIKQ